MRSGFMITFPTKARTDATGTLSLSIATGLPDVDVDVVVVVETERNGAVPPGAWPEGYFERHFGSLRDAGLECPPQGLLPERRQFE
jgi:hypothetical protein